MLWWRSAMIWGCRSGNTLKSSQHGTSRLTRVFLRTPSHSGSQCQTHTHLCLLSWNVPSAPVSLNENTDVSQFLASRSRCSMSQSDNGAWFALRSKVERSLSNDACHYWQRNSFLDTFATTQHCESKATKARITPPTPGPVEIQTPQQMIWVVSHLHTSHRRRSFTLIFQITCNTGGDKSGREAENSSVYNNNKLSTRLLKNRWSFKNSKGIQTFSTSRISITQDMLENVKGRDSERETSRHVRAAQGCFNEEHTRKHVWRR